MENEEFIKELSSLGDKIGELKGKLDSLDKDVRELRVLVSDLQKENSNRFGKQDVSIAEGKINIENLGAVVEEQKIDAKTQEVLVTKQAADIETGKQDTITLSHSVTEQKIVTEGVTKPLVWAQFLVKKLTWKKIIGLSALFSLFLGGLGIALNWWTVEQFDSWFKNIINFYKGG